MSFLDEVVDRYKNPDLERTPWHDKDLGITSGLTGYATNLGNSTGDFLKFLPKVTGHALSSMVPGGNTPIIGPVLSGWGKFGGQLPGLLGQAGRSMLPGVPTQAQKGYKNIAQTDRTTPWDTDAKYAVVRNLTAADRSFKGITDSQKATNKATGVVLKYLQKEGVEIAPEVQQAFKEGADQAIRLWMAGTMQDEQVADVSEYYMFLTEAIIEAQRSFTQDAADTSGAPSAQGTTSTAAAFATGDPQYQQQQAPAQAAAAGDYSFMNATDPAQTTPTVDMLTWNAPGGPWGEGKADLYGNQAFFSEYLKWLQGVAQPTWDRTPAGYIKYAKKQTEGGT